MSHLLYKGHRWRESKMCHPPCQTQQFLRLANCSVTWILYPFGIKQFFLQSIQMYLLSGRIYPSLYCDYCSSPESSFPPWMSLFQSASSSEKPYAWGFLCVWVWSRGEEGQGRRGACVNVCFSPREGHRQTKLIFTSNKGWRLEGGGNCQSKCMEEKYIK